MKNPGAFIFDLNGTMIDDMEYHTRAWYHILNDKLGKEMSWEDVKTHMYGKNAEMLIRVFGADRFTEEELESLSAEKEESYQNAYLPHLCLLPGLMEFLEQAREQQVKIAIGSAATSDNIDFVLDNLGIRHYFDAIVSANEVKTSKPDPETFLKAAEQLGVEPSSCIVFEDVPKGVEAALNANMQCVVLTTTHEEADFKNFPNVLATISDYTDPFSSSLFKAELAGQES
jgi:beta-phosphoglucomutase family hydrolase